MIFKLLECGYDDCGGWWLLVCGLETEQRQGYLLLVGYDTNEWKRHFDVLWCGLWRQRRALTEEKDDTTQYNPDRVGWNPEELTDEGEKW